MARKGETSLDVEHVVDGGWGWVVVVGSFMIHVLADGVSYSFGLFVQPLIEYFDVGRADVGWLGSLMIGITWGCGEYTFHTRDHVITPTLQKLHWLPIP